ncbi:MAG TPA: hypothetical protein PLJ03_08210 [Syntrophales bacterium]|nr:hypothetical protein [Syntrophales bacterium]HPQ06639.1 hypothetical protein [Syntrophales bacterium]
MARDLLGSLMIIIGGSVMTGEEPGPRDYFATFESCQPLLADAGEFLYDEADRLGIETAGRSREDIAREIFSRQKA